MSALSSQSLGFLDCTQEESTCLRSATLICAPRRNRFVDILTALALLMLLGGCDEQIVHDLSEREANRVLTVLADTDISAKRLKQPDGSWAVAVASGDAIKAIKMLSDQPKILDRKLTQQTNSSMISSRQDERFRFERSLSHEIETTLLSIPGVLESHVHLNLPVTDPLFGRPLAKQSGSASVLLVVRDNAPDSAEVASLVSGAAGIPLSSIMVVLKKIDKPADLQNAGSQIIGRLEAPTEALSENSENKVEGNGGGALRLDWSITSQRTALMIALLLLAAGSLGFISIRRNRGIRFAVDPLRAAGTKLKQQSVEGINGRGVLDDFKFVDRH